MMIKFSHRIFYKTIGFHEDGLLRVIFNSVNRAILATTGCWCAGSNFSCD